jgi:sugar transferase (PEP-CTERM/EpsH1 system associated)
MRIFFLCLRVPFPPDRGDKITTFNVVRHLSLTHEVHVFCISDGARDDANVAALGNYVRSVTAVPRSTVAEKFRGVKALLTGAPLSVAFANEKQLHLAVNSKAASLPPDLIIAYSGNVAQFAADFSNTHRLMYFADLDSQKWLQYGEKKVFPFNWIYRRESKLLLEDERRIAKTFSNSLVCTPAEKRDFERLIPGAPVDVLSNGVDLERFRSRHMPKQAGTMVFTGVMNYFPNVDGVKWFCDSVLPLIRAQVPHATFIICGTSPTATVRRLAKRPGVIVTGAVPDVRPYLDAAEICVVPLRIARGIQNKLLEGLAMGLPCVSSRCSWSGTVIEEGEGILVADDPTEFAEHAIRLLRDDQHREVMGRKARAAVEENYRWDDQLQRLDLIIQRLTGAKCPDGGRTGQSTELAVEDVTRRANLR